MMTTYEKQLIETITARWPELGPAAVMEKLIEIGVVDYTRCKVLAVREFVAAQVTAGVRKIDAMWLATERFSCSYEYVRKCVYYYRDVNLQ